MIIETNRFILRRLEISDVTETYLSWLKESEAKKWIISAGSIKSLNDLKSYVELRIQSQDILFLGIFLKKNNLHIGNIKFEPIIQREGRAELGILIGDKNYRGKKVFQEVLIASSKWIKQHLNINQISLGVERNNIAALNAYLNAGFLEDTTQISNSNQQTIRMVFNIS